MDKKKITQQINKIDKIETKLDDFSEQLDNIMSEPITLNRCDSEMLGAIQGGEGTSFELLSIPRDNSVTVEKMDTMLLNTMVEFSKYTLEYEAGAINSAGTLNNSVSNRYRAKNFFNVYDGFSIVNNCLKDIVLYLYDSQVASTNTLIERITLTKGSIKTISSNSYLLIDLMTNTLEEGNNVFLQFLSQKNIKDSSVSIPKLANDAKELLNNKAEKSELESLKTYFEDLLVANGLTINTVDIPDKFNTGIPS